MDIPPPQQTDILSDVSERIKKHKILLLKAKDEYPTIFIYLKL